VARSAGVRQLRDESQSPEDGVSDRGSLTGHPSALGNRCKRTEMLDMRVIFVGHLAGSAPVVHEERKALAYQLSAGV